MAKVTEFYAESGISWKDKHENWYKATAGIRVTIEPDDDVAKVKETAWNTVNAECEKQLKEIIQNS